MKSAKYLVFFIICFCLSVLATMPAQFALKQVPNNIPIKWGEANGPWYNFTLDWLSYQNMLWNDVQVAINPGCLFTAHICVQLHNEENDIHISTDVSAQRVSLESSTIQLDMSDLVHFMPQLLVKPKGRLNVNIERLQLQRPNSLKDIAAKVSWSDAGVAGEHFNLGKLVADVGYQQPFINVDLSDQSKLLNLAGNIKLNKQGQVTSQIKIKPLAGFPSSIKSLISSAMQRQADGFYHFNGKQVVPAVTAMQLQF